MKKPYSSTLNRQFNSISVLSFSSVQRSKMQPPRSASGTSICQLNSNFFVISAAFFRRLPAKSAQQIRRFPILSTRSGVALRVSERMPSLHSIASSVSGGICFASKARKTDVYATYSPSRKSRADELGSRPVSSHAMS